MTVQDTSQKSSFTETPSNPNIIKPDVLSVVLLDEIAVGINKLLHLLEETTPKGNIVPIVRFIDIDEVAREDINPPWCSMVLTNDGPGIIEFAINDIGNRFSIILPNEMMPIDMKRNVIRTIWLRVFRDEQIAQFAVTPTDQPALVRIFGVY